MSATFRVVRTTKVETAGSEHSTDYSSPGSVSYKITLRELKAIYVPGAEIILYVTEEDFASYPVGASVKLVPETP